MLSIQFWRSWPPVYKRFFFAFAAIAVFTLIVLWASDFRAPAPSLTPRHVHRLESVEFTSHTFRLGPFELAVPADAYLVLERVVGNTLNPNPITAYIFLAVLTFSAILVLTVFSTLSRFWFYVGMAFFVLFVISLRIESVAPFGLSNNVPTAAVLLLLGAPVYYFQFIRPDLTFAFRFFTFAGLMVGVGAVVFFSAHAPSPLLFISANGLVAGILVTLIFSCTVAHEILAALVGLISRGTRETRSLQHFLIIGGIYLLNLGLLYASRKHFIEWNLLSINLFLFITVSGILGLWGFRQRQPIYETILEPDPFGVYIYLGLGAACFATIGYSVSAANDPIVHLVEDAILYGHIGYGLIFSMYVIANFSNMLVKNLPIYRVLYKPQTMPYFTFRFAGLIATFALFALSNWKVAVDQVYAGYYNARGDISFATDTTGTAEGYYRRSLFYATRNYHAHYAMANVYAEQGDGEKEKNELQLLADSRPLDLAYLNLAECHERENAWTDAARALEEGLRDFPKNSLIENELALVYSQLNKKDSAWKMVTAAASSFRSRDDAQSNLTGLAAKFKLHLRPDSLLALHPESHGLRANALALACVQDKELNVDINPGADTAKSVYEIVSLHNFLQSHRPERDTGLINKAIALGRKDSNPYYSDFLLTGAAYACYDEGLTLQAIKLMRELASSEQDGRAYNIIGLWCLEQHAAERALRYFDDAIAQGYQPARVNRAIALTETANIQSALAGWDSVKQTDALGRRMQQIITSALRVSPENITQLTDEQKSIYARCRIPLADAAEFDRTMATIGNADLRTGAIIDRSKKLDQNDDVGAAQRTLATTMGQKLTDKSLYQEVVILNLLYLARQKNWTLLKARMNAPNSFLGKYKLTKVYLDALLAEESGKTKDAEKKFTFLIDANPFFEDAVVAAVDFLMTSGADKLKAYSSLVSALEQNPNSVKLLKAHIIASAQFEFTENAQRSLVKLKTLLPAAVYNDFVQNN